MSDLHIKVLRDAVANLRKAELEAIRKLSEDNSAANRAEFREMHDTLSTLRSSLHEHESKFLKLLKWLHILPG